MNAQEEEDDIDLRLLRPGPLSTRLGETRTGRAADSTTRDGKSSQKRLAFDDEDLVHVERTFDQIEQDDGIADILNSAIPEQSKTPAGNKQTLLERDLWADCDRGMAAQRRLTGTSVAWSSAQRIVYIIMQLIPVTRFAPDLYEWPTKGNKHQTVVKLAATYSIQRPAIIKMLTGATTVSGENARDLIDKAKQAMFAAEAIHDIVIYALHIFYWATHEDSKKQEIIDNAIDDYLRTPDADIDSLLSASLSGRYLSIDDDLGAMEGAWNMPGMRRLNFQEHAKFTKAWLDLWTVCINLLCFKEQDKSDIGEVQRALNDYAIESATHPDAMQDKAVHLIHASQRQKYIRVAEMCKRVHMTEKIPDTYSRAVNFLCAIDNTTFYKLEKMLEDDDTIMDASMTYQKTVELSLLAEQRIKKRISAMAVAKRIRSKGKKKDDKADKRQKTGEGEKEKEKEKDKGTETPKREPIVRKPPSTLTFLEVPKYLKGLTKEESMALTKKYYDERKCKNCGNFDQKFPPHRLQECPYENRIGYPWPEDHIPVKPMGTIGDRRDRTANPILVPDEDDEPAQGVRSAIKHDANGIVTTEAILIQEAQTYEVHGESEDEPQLIECPDTEPDTDDEGSEGDDDFLPLNRDEPAYVEREDFEGTPTIIYSKIDVKPGTLYLDERLQRIEPNLSLLASAKMKTWITDPASYMVSPAVVFLSWIINALLSGVWMVAHSTQTWWNDRSHSTKKTMLLSLIAVIMAACMAAIGIRAWVDPDQGYSEGLVPDFWVGPSTMGQS